LHKQISASLSSLNPKQRQAVKSDAARVLVLAGAGAGKTKTLLQKIMYLITEKGVKPDEIMAITFTKNAADEMVDRLILSVDPDYQLILDDNTLSYAKKRSIRLIKTKEYKWIGRLTVRTFHSLCYSIMKSYGAKEFDNKFKLLTDNSSDYQSELGRLSAPETQIEVLHKMLIHCCEETDFLLKFKRYVIDYMIEKLHIDSRAFIQKHPDGKYFTSLRGDKVRSKSEQYICDWLYRHNIDYIYEPNIQLQDFQFNPDFFIPEANIYLEHVSNKSGFMKDKEDQFIKGGKTLVKTYETMTLDTNLFNLALTRIIKGRISPQHKFDKALSYEEEFKGRHKEVRDFLRQVLRILDMYEVDKLSLDQITQLSIKEPHERVRLFYECCIPIIAKYEKYCIDKSYLDFNQLITKCISLIKSEEDIKNKLHSQYKYVLVDEFQDVNHVQVDLIKTMMNPAAQLFCVGDDWQSIYGFRGSNVSYIVEFTKYFKDSKIISLNKNYRSTASIVNAGNEVIKHNKFKLDKEITSINKSKRKIEVYAGTDHVDTVNYLTNEVQELIKAGYNSEDILILFRRSKMFDPYREALKLAKVTVPGKTIHASKGLEARVVFIIGMTEGSGGFPDIWMEDRIFQLIRPSKHGLMIEEERRLFYVAITRAKERLYLITELGNESSFINEIPAELKAVYATPLKHIKDLKTCSKCKNRIEVGQKFCSNCGERI
jgi:DNA helicase IV